jgi:phospholipid transport system substrate-binding protein
MSMRNHKNLSFIFVLIFLYVFPPPSNAGAPTDQVEATVEKVLAILKRSQPESEAKRQDRRIQLRATIYHRFDFTEMAKRSLGFYWRRLTAAEREEFISLFTDILEHTYVSRIEAYNDEKFVYLGEKLDGDYAEVQTRIITQNGEEFSFNYKTHLSNGEWRVYDVVAENISLVNNYRSQFNRIINKSSYKELNRMMRKKRLELLGTNKK